MKDTHNPGYHPSGALPFGPGYSWTDHLRKVIALHQLYSLRTPEDCAHHNKQLRNRIKVRTSAVDEIVDQAAKVIYDLFVENRIYLLTLPDIGTPPNNDFVTAYTRPFLNLLQIELTSKPRIDHATKAVEDYFCDLLPYLPQHTGAAFSVPFIDLVDTPGELVQSFLCLAEMQIGNDIFLFPETYLKLRNTDPH